ncbi:hypothetical protein [Actinomycetospora lemnae]|uniref:YbaB/EbfC DNA-binding family protein n=1 Tax=Actinomycetospora lemnae TaxID=3019891 RepID=A0ABT5SYM7_9PSEU|nr:hypothetical protein [Actinomycetospora sp. DW7H6]MDD7966813.1 hypothetical protein [Actinomycetospora sp. DW7H6]
MDERRWGCAGLSDEEFEQFAVSAPSRPAPVASRSRTDVVHVELDPVRVAVVQDWQATVDPRRLGGEVVVATGRAVARALEQSRHAPPTPPMEPTAPDLAPWQGSLARLLAEARRDRDRYTAAAASLAHRVVMRRSAGGHVAGTAGGGVVTAVEVDVAWAGGAQVRDLEHELTDVLAGLRRDAVPEALRHAPSHPAAVALRQLAADPALLVRAAGMRP